MAVIDMHSSPGMGYSQTLFITQLLHNFSLKYSLKTFHILMHIVHLLLSCYMWYPVIKDSIMRRLYLMWFQVQFCFSQVIEKADRILQFSHFVNSFRRSNAIEMAEILVNISSGNGLLPDSTKPLPEPMLTDHQWSPVTFILRQFHKRCLNHQSLKSIWKLHI